LNDGSEVNQHKTDPLLPDTDNDGLNDLVELETYQTGPNNRDTDSDGLTDGEEVLKYKTLPKVADTDRGSILDGAEVQRGTNPLNYDDDIDRRPKMEKGKAVVLEGIEFDTGKSTIRSSSEPILNGVFQAMMENPEVVAMISGHTDNVGKKNGNMKLSQARADAVKSWLVMKGIDSRRLITKGYGPERPIADNKTEEGRQKNRRIEFERIK
jgi:outer membrane protein OmpA-like peptidoglycan-associated protein